MSKNKNAFTLVETVIALGIFAFAIVTLVGLLPIGLRSTRDVANEANAISVSSSVFGAWRHGALNSTVTLPNIITNLNIYEGNNVFYFNDSGSETISDNATFRMIYNVIRDPNIDTIYRVDLICTWPANATDTVAQRRVFSETFNK